MTGSPSVLGQSGEGNTGYSGYYSGYYSGVNEETSSIWHLTHGKKQSEYVKSTR